MEKQIQILSLIRIFCENSINNKKNIFFLLLNTKQVFFRGLGFR